MNAEALCFTPITELVALVHRGEISAREVTRTFLDRIARLDRVLNCFTRVMAEDALAQAAQVDATLGGGGTPGLLTGVPIGIKDIVDVGGVPTTHGAHRMFHSTPTADAPVVRQLRRHGAVIIGKTNLHEFAYGVTNNNPHFGPTRNPWDLSRIPGGSSGGSAAAVAAGLCAAAVGTDTGGSIRIPAALCGIVGIKPTYDRISREGVTPLAWSLDHVGPLTRTVEDAKLLLRVMAGVDFAGDTTRSNGRGGGTGGEPTIVGMRVGLPRRFFWEGITEDVRTLVEGAVGKLEGLGAHVLEVDLPHAALAGDAVAVIISVEATAAHETRLRTYPNAYGADVRVRLESGFFVSGTDYVQAQRVRTMLLREFRAALERVDVLALPTTALTAPSIDQVAQPGPSVSVPVRLPLIRLTNPFNLTGLPALSIPCGLTAQGLPVGLQLVGRVADEETVFRVARTYERTAGWMKLHPQVAANPANGSPSG